MSPEPLPLNSEFLMTFSAELGSSHLFGSRAVAHIVGGGIGRLSGDGVRYSIHQIL